MKLKTTDIPCIEEALGIRLYDHQKNYLLGIGGGMSGGRRVGKTTAYCIALALSDGNPLNLRKPWEFSDEPFLTNHRTYSVQFFRYEFLRIRKQLKDAGFTVRSVR
jgi:hypothetical protein